ATKLQYLKIKAIRKENKYLALYIPYHPHANFDSPSNLTEKKPAKGKMGLSVLLACLVASSAMLGAVMGSNNVQVGGRDGWVVNPSESYDHWAQRLRFQVNDSLVFKNEQGSNSVLQVNKAEYHSCDTSNPLKSMDSGSFQFDRSGPFYFISANKTNCLNGQKLAVVVLAVRTPKTPITPPPSSSPALPPTTASPVPSLPPKSLPPTPSLAPQPSAASSPSPISAAPSLAPQPSAASSPSPISATPSLAPQPSAASSPSPISAAPSLAPEPSAASSPSPAASSPAPSDSNAPAGAPGPATSPAGAPGPATAPASAPGPGGAEDTNPGAADQLSPADSIPNMTPPSSSSAWRGVAGVSPTFVVVVGLAGLLTYVM
ncbi:Early nodulin-like protein 2, partial [Linum grandiflorum]